MSGGVTRDDLDAYLREHPEIVERRREVDRRRKEAIQRFQREEGRVLVDLQAAGVNVASLDDLANRKLSRSEYLRALPVLIEWLRRMTEPDVKWSIVRALGASHAREARKALIEEFRRPQPNENVAWQIGNALSRVADASAFDDVAALLRDRRYGRARQQLCRALVRTKDPRAEGVLIEVLDDDDVTAQSIEALGKLRSTRARPKIETFLTHPNALFRREAKRVLRRIDSDTSHKR
jgi:HEAT repeat protein